MAFQISVNAHGIPELMKRIGHMKAARELPDILGKSVVAGIKRTFDKSQDPDTGRQWAPLWMPKGASGARRKPLVNSGKFRRSIHYIARANAVTVGTNFAWARVHQEGRTIRAKRAPALVFRAFGVLVFAKKVTIPARPFLPMTDAGLQRVTSGTLRDQVFKYMLRLAGDDKR